MKSKKRNHLRKAGAVLLLTLLLGIGSAGSALASAQAPVDTERTDCSITLNMAYKENGVSKNLTGGEVSLYTVATVVEDEGYRFDVTTGKFAGVEGVSDLPAMDSEQLSKVNFSISKTLEGKLSGVKADDVQKISGGQVSFTGLKPGLYLIAQTVLSDGERKVNPFLISIPDEDGVYNIVGDPKASVYSPTPPNPPTPDKPKPPTPGGKLPQTGQLWWPVAVMGIGGLFFLIMGLFLRRRQDEGYAA